MVDWFCLLLERGFRVKIIYLTQPSPEELYSEVWFEEMINVWEHLFRTFFLLGLLSGRMSL